jgi:hypothetical protein
MRSQAKWILGILLTAGLVLPAFAQDADPPDQAPSSGGWRRLGGSGDPGPASAPQGPYPADPQGPYRAGPSGPSEVTVPAGTWINIRVDQVLSSDHNQPGDAFMGSLAQPIIANGVVIARRGQTVAGRVAVAEKAGRVKGTSRLGLELTEISLVDGRQMPVRSRLMEYSGGTSVGRDAAAIGTTTAVGAAIGAVADGGFGAGMGAIAGAAASTIGVLATRGRATEVYPEAPLTFRLEAPTTVSGAFPPVGPQDYEQRNLAQRRPVMRGAPPPSYYGYGYGGYPYPSYYPYYGYGFGPSFFFYGGRGFYSHRGFRR